MAAGAEIAAAVPADAERGPQGGVDVTNHPQGRQAHQRPHSELRLVTLYD